MSLNREPRRSCESCDHIDVLFDCPCGCQLQVCNRCLGRHKRAPRKP